MAAPVWPSYARIQSRGIEVAAAPTVTRTEFDDGAVRQARRGLRPITQRTVTAEIAGDRLIEFRAWAEAHAHAWFRARDLDGAWRDMRVVGGVGGITYRQVARRAGPAWWEAGMVLEDGPPAFLFPDARVEWVARLRSSSSVVLPAALGGTAPITYSLPRIPSLCTYDPATRTLTSPSDLRGRRNVLDGALYRYVATDADGRTATMELVVARAYDIDCFVSYAAGNVSMAATLDLPSQWLVSPDTTRELTNLTVYRSGRVTLEIGPDGPTDDLTDAAERDLRLVCELGGHELLLHGPASAQAIARDTSEPYDWTLPAAPIAAWIDTIGDQATSGQIYAWLALPP